MALVPVGRLALPRLLVGLLVGAEKVVHGLLAGAAALKALAVVPVVVLGKVAGAVALGALLCLDLGADGLAVGLVQVVVVQP
mgnify:CR=1 FL=1